jgi:hypothetical protein
MKESSGIVLAMSRIGATDTVTSTPSAILTRAGIARFPRTGATAMSAMIRAKGRKKSAMLLCNAAWLNEINRSPA